MEKTLVIAVKEGAKNQPIKIEFSSIMNYEDEDSEYKINNVNNKLCINVTQQAWILLTIQILMDHIQI